MTLEMKRKKKKKNVYIGGNIYNESSEEIMDTETQIRLKLKRIMRSHIGIENSISPNELFFQIFGSRPDELNIYKRLYWWDVIKKELRYLRRMNELFTVIKGSKIFVLSNREELFYYLKVSNKHIESIKSLQSNAVKWINNKMYKRI